ncbi:WbqC family protein [soil metagenome]
MPTTLLTELPYIGSLAFHALVRAHAPIYIEALENFQKATYRNRAHIAGPNGIERLTIPIEEGRGLRCPISEVRISYAQPWPKLHWSAIVAAYGRSPYFEFYQHELQPLYESPGLLLFGFNLKVIQTTWRLLNIKSELHFTKDYYKSAPEGWLDIRGALHPNLEKNQAAEWTHEMPYYQVFQDRNGYLPDMCAWDLLFNEGPNAGNILKQMVK